MPATVEHVAKALSKPGASGVIGVIALVSFFPAVAVLSATNPLVVKLQLKNLAHTGQVVGRLSALGTAGALAGTFTTGFVLVPAFPTSRVVLVLGAGLVLAGAAISIRRGTRGRLFTLGAIVCATTMVLGGTTRGAHCDAETSYTCAKVLRDPARPTGRLLVLDTITNSYVDLRDPTFLYFGYARAFGRIVDALRPAGEPLRVLHIGGGGFTIPRYVAATRPGSSNEVLEIDEGLVRLDERRLGVHLGPQLRVRIGDARPALRRAAKAVNDLVVGDAFAGRTVPWHLTTKEAATAIRRTLRPKGAYALNMIDQPPLDLVRAEARTLLHVFRHVALIATPEQVAGADGGNFVFLASDAALPVRGLSTLIARGPDQQDVAIGAAFARFAGSGDILTDDYAPADQLITR
jgi:hypothetical protein